MRVAFVRFLSVAAVFLVIGALTGCNNGTDPTRAYVSSMHASQTSAGPPTATLRVNQPAFIWVDVENAIAFETTLRIEVYYGDILAGGDIQTSHYHGVVWFEFVVVPAVTGQFTFRCYINGVSGPNSSLDVQVVS